MSRKIKRSQSKDPQVREALRHMRAIAGMERERFFKENGDLKQWRPRRQVAVNKKRKQNKNACRGGRYESR